jgi:carboxylesterase type B
MSQYKATTLADLRALPAEALLAAPPLIAVDGFVMSDLAGSLLKQGNAHVSEMVAGVTGQDGLLSYQELQMPGTVPNTTANITATLESYVGYDGTAQTIYDMYVTGDKVDPRDERAMAMAFLQMNSDVCLACPTTELLDDMGATPSWFYHFTYNPLPTFAGLAFHAGELPTLFGYLINPLRAAVFPPPDAGLSAEFMGRFTGFARTGSAPEYPGAIAWPKYSSTQRDGVQFDTPKTTAVTAFKSDKCAQWAKVDYMVKYYFCWYAVQENPNPAVKTDAEESTPGMSTGVLAAIVIGVIAIAGLGAVVFFRSASTSATTKDEELRLELEQGNDSL